MKVEIYKALSDENRLRILNVLMEKSLCVCELEAILEMNQSNVSRHLSKLKYANIVESKKESQWIHYKIDPNWQKENPDLYQHLKKSFALDSTFVKEKEKMHSPEYQNIACEKNKTGE